MSQSPKAGWSNASHQRRLPPTPTQRRRGTQIGIGVILLALFVIVLLDRFGVIH